jgi:glucose-6-phosphate 1-dehydrogenase
VIDRLVIFGGTGDLTGRYLFPALAALMTRGHLSEGWSRDLVPLEEYGAGSTGPGGDESA